MNTARELAATVADGSRSPSEIISSTLHEIDRLNPSVNAIAFLRDEGARADARAAEERLARGESARELEGVPITIKDLCPVADAPMTFGSRAFAGFRPGVDAEMVRRLRDAGAIIVAITTTPEFAARPTTESDAYGATRNPWDLAHTTGGSSGGAAACAALGIAPINHGSDAGGSIRIPSSACGVFGLKPARGRITLGPLLSEEWGGLDVWGPLTRDVRDAALFLDITAGPMTGDPYWAAPPSTSFLSACDRRRPLRIAVAFERDGIGVDRDVAAAVRATADALATLGHTVEEAQPDLARLEEPFVAVSTAGIGSMPLRDDQLELLEPRSRLIVDVARALPAAEYLKQLHKMRRASREVLGFFERYDVLVTPTLTRPAPRIGEIGTDMARAWDDYRGWICWTFPFNCTGQPAASIPAGFSPDGLPIGVQIVGGAADEATVLSVAAQLEGARPWRDAVPRIG